MAVEETPEIDAPPQNVDEPEPEPPTKRKPGRPKGSLNKKTVAQAAASKADKVSPVGKQIMTTAAEAPKTRRKPSRRPPSRSSERSSSESPPPIVTRVSQRRKKQRVIVMDSDSSPSPVIVKRRKTRAAEPPSPPPQPSQTAPPQQSLAQLGQSLQDVHMQRMMEQHQRYNTYFARCR